MRGRVTGAGGAVQWAMDQSHQTMGKRTATGESRAEAITFLDGQRDSQPRTEIPIRNALPLVTVPPLPPSLSLSIVASFPALTNDFEDEQSG